LVLGQKVAPISSAVTVVGKMFTAIFAEPLDLEAAASEGWKEELTNGAELRAMTRRRR
jgi:hypothetical protein